MADAPIRYTRAKASVELTFFKFFLFQIYRLFTWVFRRTKPIFYHPIALAGLTLLVWSYIVSPWFTAALFWALLVWERGWPYSFRDQVFPRVASFGAGFKYRHRPRKKLKAMGLLADDEPVATVSWVTKIGCTTRIRIKMQYGDDIEWWREKSSRLAQTYNAGDCRINPYRRDNYLTLRPSRIDKAPYVKFTATEKTEKYRWLVIDFLTKNPFTSSVGVEYLALYRTKIGKGINEAGEEIDLYLPQDGDPVGPKRDGTPYLLKVETHLLNISITGGGKSNAERTMIYSGYGEVMAKRKENWGIDLARGVELRPISHCFARIEDGRDGPQAVYQYWVDVRTIMWKRLDEMEANGLVLFVPSEGKPALDVYFDEMGILETVPYAEYRKAIYATISEILVQGRKAKISVRAFSQNPKLERLPLRDDFPEVHLGKVKTRSQVRMAMDDEAYERGAKAPELDLPGEYFAETQSGMVPEHFRFVETTLADMKLLPQAPKSVLWPGTVEEQKDISGVLIY